MMGSGDIQKSDFIRALFVVALRHFNRVTRVFDVDKLHTFDHPTIVNIKARDNSFC